MYVELAQCVAYASDLSAQSVAESVRRNQYGFFITPVLFNAAVLTIPPLLICQPHLLQTRRSTISFWLGRFT
jgi:hypothetical protein